MLSVCQVIKWLVVSGPPGGGGGSGGKSLQPDVNIPIAIAARILFNNILFMVASSFVLLNTTFGLDANLLMTAQKNTGACFCW